jgi:hypothetical protein
MQKKIKCYRKYFMVLIIILAFAGFLYGNVLSNNTTILDNLQGYGMKVNYPVFKDLLSIRYSQIKDPYVPLISNVPENKVVRIYNPELNNWDYADGENNHFADNTNLEEYNRTFREGLMELTQTNNIVDAWVELLGEDYENDKVAIKMNMNSYYFYANQDPKMPYVIVDSLINNMNFNPDNIKIYDVSREIHTHSVSWWRAIWESYNTEVEIIDSNDHILDYNSPIIFSDYECSTAETQYLPTVVSEADHIINLHLMKGHTSYATGAMKNHFGTITEPSDLHYTGRLCNAAILTTHSLIGGKTRLLITEATYMTSHKEGHLFDEPMYEDLFPVTGSGSRSPNSFFFAVNSVAIDTVTGDFLNAERSYRNEVCGNCCGINDDQYCNTWDNEHIDYAVEMDSYWNGYRPTSGVLIDNPEGFSVKDFSYVDLNYVSRTINSEVPECYLDDDCVEDGFICTLEYCNGGSCSYIINSSSCFIANECYLDGEHNPVKYCEVCNITFDQDRWEYGACKIEEGPFPQAIDEVIL